MPDHVRDGETAVARLVVDGRIARHPTPAARAESLDLPPGGSRWSIVTFGPGVDAELHETATIDYDLILSGSVDLLLDKGEVRLSTGDAVVIPGARHGWRTTDEACQMTVVMCSPEGGAA
jgi:quercetin dioxygenase-like cupin family protein